MLRQATYLFTAVLLGAASVAHAAASLKLSGSYADKIVTDPAGGYATTNTGTGSLSANVPISGVDISAFDASTAFAISFGDNGEIFNMTLGADSTYTAGKKSAHWTDSSGTMSISWTATTLTISGSAKFDFFQVGSLYSDGGGKIQNDARSLTFTLGDYVFERPVFLSGNSTNKPVTKGTGDNAQEFNLLTVSVSGDIDQTPPTVTLTSPVANAIVTNGDLIYLSGKATDNKAVSEVLYYVSTSPKLTGDETFEVADADPLSGAWVGSFTAVPGTNYIFVSAVDTSSNVAPLLRRSVYCRQLSSLSVAVVEGQGTFSGVANGQMLEVGRAYSVTTKPAAGQVLAYWATDTEQGHASTFTFTMRESLSLTLGFRANPFPILKGTYTGLFFDHDNGVNPTNAGIFTATVSSNGAYSAKLTLLSGSASFSGQLALAIDNTNSASADFNLSRPKLPALSGTMTFDLSGSGVVGGVIEQYFTNSTNPITDIYLQSAFEGKLGRPAAAKAAQKIYNVAFSGSTTNNAPEGHTYGTATLAGSGTVSLALNPADRNPLVSVGSAIDTDGNIPVFAPLYANQGAILGWLTVVTNDPQTDLTGTNILWVKPVVSKATSSFYTNDFYLTMSAQGSLYVAPKSGANLLGWTNGSVAFSDSNFSSNEVTSLTFNASKNQFLFASGQNPNKVTLTLAPATGLLSGGFTPTGRTKALTFKGIILPKQGVGYGFFTDTNRTGSVLLLPPTVEPTDPGILTGVIDTTISINPILSIIGQTPILPITVAQPPPVIQGH